MLALGSSTGTSVSHSIARAVNLNPYFKGRQMGFAEKLPMVLDKRSAWVDLEVQIERLLATTKAAPDWLSEAQKFFTMKALFLPGFTDAVESSLHLFHFEGARRHVGMVHRDRGP